MLPFTLSSLLARNPRSGRRRAQRAQEPADMGTAFGMEQWLDERDHGNAGASKPPATAKNATVRGWVPRWLQSARTPRG